MTYRVLMAPPSGRLNWTEAHRGPDFPAAVKAFLTLVELSVIARGPGGGVTPLELTADPAGQSWLMRTQSVEAPA